MYIQMLYICKIFLEELIFILNKNLEQMYICPLLKTWFGQRKCRSTSPNVPLTVVTYEISFQGVRPLCRLKTI